MKTQLNSQTKKKKLNPHQQNNKTMPSLNKIISPNKQQKKKARKPKQRTYTENV